MPKLKTIFICTECGYETSKWMGKCPSCNNFNTLEEDVIEKIKTSEKKAKSRKPQTLKNISSMSETRIKTRITELDRVLSGGIVEGSLTLVGGDPGIGKSTILLQICQNIGDDNKKILYVSGEESAGQIKMRAERLSVTTENLLLLAETNVGIVEETIKDVSPDLVIVDSIQTIYREELTGVPGSISQIRDCTQLLMHMAKSIGVSIIIVGHVTKQGALAGPKVLEHMVDTVLYFEGEKSASYRIIRAVKNRFGSTNEIGVFEMQEKGLMEITNPSEYMLSGRPIGVPGSAVTCNIEGSRPILIEVQALISYTNFGIPRRVSAGFDYNRVVMLLAVLEKRIGMQFGNYDGYVNIAGGLKVAEPSLDAAVISAIVSSYKNAPIDPYIMIFGEVGLTGEIRAVTNAEKRISEASRLGFKQCIIPQANLKGIQQKDNMRIFGVSNVSEVLNLITKE